MVILLLLIMITGCSSKKKEKKEEEKETYNENINVVLSLEDSLENNTIWCGTFNLVWNILKNDLAKQDIVFENQTNEINNLNKTVFNSNELNDDTYYTKYGFQTPELKEEIEKAIKDKFNQNSDILDDFEWEKDSKKTFIYAMIYKQFTFEEKFTKLNNHSFNNEGEYNYFGINSKNRSGINNVSVLYYNNSKDFAVKLLTKEGDEVILVKNDKKDSLLNIYNEMNTQSEKYDGEKYLDNEDTLMIPFIKFNVKKEIDSVAGKKYKWSDGSEHIINKAVQTIKFELDEYGGKIKSEAAISDETTAALDENEPRNFEYTSNFYLFLKNKDKNLPYFGAYITSLKDFQ